MDRGIKGAPDRPDQKYKKLVRDKVVHGTDSQKCTLRKNSRDSNPLWSLKNLQGLRK